MLPLIEMSGASHESGVSKKDVNSMSFLTDAWNQYWSFLLATLLKFNISSSALQPVAILVTVILAILALRILGALLGGPVRYRSYRRGYNYDGSW